MGHCQHADQLDPKALYKTVRDPANATPSNTSELDDNRAAPASTQSNHNFESVNAQGRIYIGGVDGMKSIVYLCTHGT